MAVLHAKELDGMALACSLGFLLHPLPPPTVVTVDYSSIASLWRLTEGGASARGLQSRLEICIWLRPCRWLWGILDVFTGSLLPSFLQYTHRIENEGSRLALILCNLLKCDSLCFPTMGLTVIRTITIVSNSLPV